MGILKKPSISLYWSADPLYHTPVFQNVMKRDRYLLILRFLHMVDNDDLRGTTDRLFKIRPLIDDLSEKFQKFYTPTQDLALDESLLLWKGRLLFRQYLPAKRARFGIKIFSVCDQNGYTCRFRVYTGADASSNEITSLIGTDACNMNKTEQLTVYMMLPFLGKGYSLYVDNYYTTVALFQYLHKNSTNVCGTVRKNRVPNIIKNHKLQKGESKYFARGNLMRTKFADKKEVYLLSSLHTTGTTTVAQHGRRHTFVEKPNAVIAYNQRMGAVDRMDQLLEPYSAPRKSLKWYHKLAIHLIQVSMLNAYCLYRSNFVGSRRKTFLQFQHCVLTAMFFNHDLSAPTLAEQTLTRTDFLSRLVGRHFIARLPASDKKQHPTKRCRVCHARGLMRKETRYFCNDCPSKPGLCIDKCFEIYHKENVF